MKYISLFAGIGCADVAWAPFGWEPVCFSEIDPFASAVLAHRFPGVPNVGDVTKHDWSRYRGKVDLVVGGSPCQAFSCAGLRKSLDDERGNLTLEFVRACHAIHPAFIVWENVPSVQFTHDQAYGCFLGGLVGSSGPLQPDDTRGRWPDSGVVVGPERAVAWRIMDARFRGVPQRRRRIFLVAVALSHPAFVAGGAPNPAAVLFDWAGVPGHPPPRRTAGKGHPPVPAAGAGGHGPGAVRTTETDISPAVTAKWAKGSGGPVGDECQNLVAIPIIEVGKRTGTAGARAKAGVGCGLPGDPMYTLQAGAKHGVAVGPLPEVSGTLGGGSGTRGYANSLDVAGLFVPMVPDSLPEVAGTLTQRLGSGGPDDNDAARGMYVPVDPATGAVPTGGDVQAVAFTAKDSGADAGAVAPTLRAMGHHASHGNGGGQVAVAVAGEMHGTALGGDVAHTLRAEGADASEDGTGRGTPVVAAALRGRGDSYAAEASEGAAFALRASQGGSDKAFVASGPMVRRLTPMECERLMGLPDHWTLIPYGRGRRQKDLAEMAAYYGVTPEVAKTLAADSLRYKAIGNGMAVPCIWWIGMRIEWVLERLAAWDGRFDDDA